MFPSSSSIKISIHFCFLLLVCSTFLACKKDTPPTPTPNVSVSKPLMQEVLSYDEYSGHLDSPRVVNLTARVSGIVTQTPFTEGAMVKTGDVLFVIDDRPFKAELDRAQAQFSVAEANYKRFESVKGTKAVSAAEYDQAVAQAQQAQAALRIARLNLDWTKVTAPIDGRAGRKLVTEGNLVNGGSGETTPLTSITSIDPIYAYVNVPERAFLKYQKLSKEANQNSPDLKDFNLPCAIQLENETSFLHKGTIDFVDNHIDPSTGTMEMRGVIPNPDGALTPGLFARMKIQADKPHQALLVPDAAVGSDQNSKYVSVIGNENTVQVKPVKLGTLVGKLREITEGITKDDVVVVNGFQSARPNTKVALTEVIISPDGSIITPTPAQSLAATTVEKK
jgi:multidrug efflux system membrane fusion protein